MCISVEYESNSIVHKQQLEILNKDIENLKRSLAISDENERKNKKQIDNMQKENSSLQSRMEETTTGEYVYSLMSYAYI